MLRVSMIAGDSALFVYTFITSSQPQWWNLYKRARKKGGMPPFCQHTDPHFALRERQRQALGGLALCRIRIGIHFILREHFDDFPG